MILTECAVFSAAFLAGMIAAAFTMLFAALGGASKVARAVFDFLTPLVAAGIFFLSAYLSTGGVFRFYFLAAFVLGGVAFSAVYKKCRPLLKRLILRVSVPILSLENAVARLLSPLAERLKQGKERRAKRRSEARRLRLKKREINREKSEKEKASRRKKRRLKRRIAARRRKIRAAERGGGRRGLTDPAIQSH